MECTPSAYFQKVTKSKHYNTKGMLNSGDNINFTRAEFYA